MTILYTIGHSTHSVETLIGLLRAYDVTAVADVRSRPYSPYNPQFNREALESSLKVAGLTYVFLGRELGARSDDPDTYIDGKVQYDLLARTDSFISGLRRLQEGARKYTLTMLCSEKEPLSCHRTILISRHVESEDISVQHILESGRVERHSDTMQRLVVPQLEFFRSPNEVLEEAYRVRGEQIAYVRPSADAQQTQESGGSQGADLHDWIH